MTEELYRIIADHLNEHGGSVVWSANGILINLDNYDGPKR